MLNNQKWEVLLSHIMNCEYESLISHNEISEIIEEEYGSNKYRATLNRVKNELFKNGKLIESVWGSGYKIISPDSYVDKSLEKFKQGFTQLEKGYELLENAPVAHMSKEGKEVYNDVSNKALNLYTVMANGCIELKMLKKRHALSPENIGRR